MNDILVIDVTSGNTSGLGKKSFKDIPRVGEWVELEEDGKAVMYLVAMVAHSSVGAGCDIYVKRVDIMASAIKKLSQL